MPDWGSIPWLGVLGAVVASQIIGFLWYGPLFGKQWIAGMGKSEEEMKNTEGLGQAIGVGVVSSIVSAIALALLITLSESPDVESGCKIGLLVAAIVSAYIVITMMYEQRNRTVSVINIANQVVTLVVMGAVIGAMW